MGTFVSRKLRAVVLAAVALSLTSCHKAYRGPTEPLALGLQPLDPAVPIVVALDRQFFLHHGVRLTVKNYDTGLGALNGVLKGEVDVAANVSDYVFAAKWLEGKSLRILATFDRDDYVHLLGRMDKGITDFPDLKGKRFGLLRGTAQEFYLGRFLQLHGIDIRDVTLVNVATLAESVNLIVRGDIDALITVDPYLNDAQLKLGENAVAWPVQSSQPFYALLAGKSEWIPSHAKLAERFLAALDEAENFILQHPEQAKLVAEKKMGFSRELTDRFWPRNFYALSLDQSLIAALQDEARWMMAQGLTTAQEAPGFRDAIYADGLKAVKPEAVTIIE
jgi:ABC-type nitrate/sulfonate/bicarbonate transport system substrate-binding protein